MEINILKTKIKKNETVLALGPESSGNFSVFQKGKIFFFRSGDDLLDEKNFDIFRKSVLAFLRKEKIKPDIILTDLHPRYRTTKLGHDLAKKFGSKNIKAQHHVAHIFSSVGDRIISDDLYKIPRIFYGVACDGTGFGKDGKIWGGEIFEVKSEKEKVKCIRRIGHLENQVLIGGDLAMREPARMLISILGKLLDKKEVYSFVKEYYLRNQFEALYNQLQEKFNCQETSSTARVLDAVSILLGYSENTRNRKHGPVFALEKNSTRPYNFRPKIIFDDKEKNHILLTTPLFKYLLKNKDKDKKRLAATAQIYLAKGLAEIAKKEKKAEKCEYFFSGGMADNKIMSEHLSLQEFYLSKKIPRGDAGLSFGQIFYYLSGY